MFKIGHLRKIKATKNKFAALVLYDNAFCKTAVEGGIDLVVVGDSVVMSLFGSKTTINATMEMMIAHTEAVAKSSSSIMVVADLPYMSYSNFEDARLNASKLMKAGADMVKLEGDQDWVIETVKHLTEYGIPVCAHIGLTPQFYHQIGGNKIMGRDDKEYQRLLTAAKSLDSAGAEMIVLECIPSTLGKEITETINAITLGAGAGVNCDGQVMLAYDLIGLSGNNIKFAKDYLIETNNIKQAINNYVSDVKSSKFPDEKHSYQ
ncbi:MAG: 3-methyl-2-oxobutanoate hydroxymethyltransferase [Neisseriaceae bacterium]|nr:MAG: 3-methyl-2-oxobutanoate hydroxymethyltransferase [Neisseriaceae bacterium]